MSTGTKIVQGALSRIGAHSIVRPANPESLEVGRDALNSLHAGWQDNGIEFGGVPIEAIGDDFSEPLGLTNTIMDNLAIQLQPLFPGTQISQDLRINANKSYQKLLAKCQAITIPKPIVRETLPKGQGNTDNSYYDETFFSEGDTVG